MGYLISSVVFGVAGIVLGILSYWWSEIGYAYSYVSCLGAAASIVFLVSFALLEYALRCLEFGGVFTVWAGSMAVVLTIFSVFFWGESLNPLGIVSVVIAAGGLIGLSLSDKNT